MPWQDSREHIQTGWLQRHLPLKPTANKWRFIEHGYNLCYAIRIAEGEENKQMKGKNSGLVLSKTLQRFEGQR